MSADSKEMAYAKIEMIARNVGVPPWIFNDAAISDYYSRLNVSLDDDTFTTIARVLQCLIVMYLCVCVQMQRWSAWKKYSLIGREVDRYEWPMSPAVVNAA
jgi:predicted metalloendopeptidase